MEGTAGEMEEMEEKSWRFVMEEEIVTIRWLLTAQRKSYSNPS